MTPASQLRAKAAELHRQADVLLQLADALDAGQAAIAPAPDRWLDIHQAEILTNASRTTLRRWAAKFGCGERTGSGQWRFRRVALLEVALTQSQRGANVSPGGANGAGLSLPLRRDEAQLHEDERGDHEFTG